MKARGFACGRRIERELIVNAFAIQKIVCHPGESYVGADAFTDALNK
jgi:hypothetical protein